MPAARVDVSSSFAELALERVIVDALAKAAFDPSKHMRGQKGTHQGGKFVSASTQQSAGAAHALKAAVAPRPGGRGSPGGRGGSPADPALAQRIAALKARLGVLDRRISLVRAQLRKLAGPPPSPASKAQSRSQAAKKAAQTRKSKGVKRGQPKASTPAKSTTPVSPQARQQAALQRRLTGLEASRRRVQVELARASARSSLSKAGPGKL